MKAMCELLLMPPPPLIIPPQVFAAYADLEGDAEQRRRFGVLQNALLWRIWTDDVRGSCMGLCFDCPSGSRSLPVDVRACCQGLFPAPPLLPCPHHTPCRSKRRTSRGRSWCGC